MWHKSADGSTYVCKQGFICYCGLGVRGRLAAVGFVSKCVRNDSAGAPGNRSQPRCRLNPLLLLLVSLFVGFLLRECVCVCVCVRVRCVWCVCVCVVPVYVERWLQFPAWEWGS